MSHHHKSQSEEKIIIHMNMCSNGGSTSGCGCGSGGGHGNGNGNGNGVSMWSSSLKKQQQQQQQQQKRPRIPKRGPGVAELEKILREQESTIDLTTNDRGINNEGFSVSSSCLFPHFSSSRLKSHQPLPPPPPPPSQRLNSSIPPAPKFDVMPPIIGSMYGNGNGNGNTHSLLGRNSGGGSGEHELFPRNLNFSTGKSKPNLNEAADGSQSDSGNSPSRNLSSDSNHANWNYPATIQKRNNGYPPQPMINQFHGNGGNQASSGSLSIGLHNHIEPPSIQNNSYYNYSSTSQEENKMVDMKRPHSSSLENTLISPSNFQILPSFSRYGRPQQSSTNDNHGVSSYTRPTNECYRDSKWGSTLELSNKRFNSENAASSGHAIIPSFVAPEVPLPPPPMHLLQNAISKGNMFPCQAIEEKIENSFQRSESSGRDRKRFFNFLEVEGQEGVTEATSGSNHGGHDGGGGGRGGGGGGGGLDLSLKL